MLEDIKNVLNQTMEELGLKRGIENAKALTCWEEVVGDKIAAHSQAFKVKKGTLFVTTTSPTWAQELSLMRKELIKKINKHTTQDKIYEIRFVARGVNPKDKSDFNKNLESLENTPLTKVDINEIEKTIAELKDQELKERLKRVLICDKKLKNLQKRCK